MKTESVKVESSVMRELRQIAKNEGFSLQGLLSRVLREWVSVKKNVHPTAQK